MPLLPGMALQAPRAALIEIKHALSGSSTRFELELWRLAPESWAHRPAVGRWLAKKAAYGLEAGSWSWGVWHTEACPVTGGAVSWGAYRIHAPDGRLLCHRFDCLERTAVAFVPGEPVLRRSQPVLAFLADDHRHRDADVPAMDDESEWVETSVATLSFHDLLLDFEVSAEGEVKTLDEDEVAAAVASAALSEAQQAHIAAFKAAFLADPELYTGAVDAEIASAEMHVQANGLSSGGGIP